jgi:hypothetical protein
MANEVYGTDLYMYMNGVVVGHSTSHALSTKVATRKTSNKDSGIYDTSAPARINPTVSCDGLVAYTDLLALRTAIVLRTPVSLDLCQQATGGAIDTTYIYAMGNFIMTGLDESFPDGGNATYKVTYEHSSGFTFVSTGALTVRIAHTDALTHGGSTGAAFAIPAGGTAPYTYAWTGGATTQYITAKAAGTYSVTVTDSTGGTPLTATATVIINQP